MTPASGQLKQQLDAKFFQFTSVVADCPSPAGPVFAESLRNAHAVHHAGQGGKASEVAEDLKIASRLKVVLGNAQIYTHSPLVNSSLWATVQGRVVTIEGCVAGDIPTGFDHAFIRTQLQTLVLAVPGVLQTVVLIRTSEQLRANLAVPYKVAP